MPMLDESRSNAQALTENDPVLHRLLESSDLRVADAAFEDLFRRAQPVIEAITGHYRRRAMLDSSACEDIASTVRVRLLLKLRRLAHGDTDPIATYEGFVARLTYNAVNDVFRNRHPERVALKKRLREIAEHDSRFAVDTTVQGIVFRLAGQTGQAAAAPMAVGLLPADVGDSLEMLLRAARGPLLLDDVLAALYIPAEPSRRSSADTDTPLLRLERREELALLWAEILLLPLQQRVALLLNLRGEGRGRVIALLVLLGVTTFEELAAALAMTAEELAAVWSELPLDDLTIAERLGVTRQQVINLRKSARKRIDRRRRWK